MRKHLMLSTAAIGLMLASGFAYAQAPGERRDEPRRTEEPAKGAGPQRGGAQERVQERAQGAQERLQGAGREEKGGAAKQDASDDKRQPASSAERNQPKSKDQAQESREPSRDRNREAESPKPGRDGKNSAETKQDKSAPQKSTAESEKSKSGTSGQQNERTGAAANQNERNQTQPPRNAAEQQQPAQQNNRPATATDTNRTAPTNNAQTAPATSGTQTNQANQTPQTNTQANQQTQVTSEKQVRISETVSRARLAEPERNLNISIRVGETIPSRVRLHRLPPEIVAIEPEYRDYEYFSTGDDVVIVEPRTHRIVSQVPRDPSRARAQMSGGTSSSMAAAGGSNVNCQIMRRDASGNVAQAEPSTVGSTARTDSLSVTVQMPGGGSSAPIALGAPAGNIVVATQGQGDCTVTIEPQTR
ncbi:MULTISPECIES: DUF1236 domain-containing protein [Bradyrhizobium]|jgi:hypothetical protein|uniref:DUF1236 domain-containing protein n=2 Tax=Bradyrhizobium TaxID=374 RepID=A0A1X3ES07_9BRAD|nr:MULTISPECIES: DUF1236 domain-containing protein [Bradyrhizobium]MCK1304632.1 DUF1236 domain-containing protein [Bradyrhizobium sp. 45]MCK1323003.1 DUF1236 domain-containing protein [Bradyrhizobium sp. 156]MCK1350908.1 DUF1236 domain-containing protein [Bradyrhizobium sp. CW7]MCK1437079.1 DUF1236 domain-containing protein [Bradyrhizobium sp. 15]MCK1497931.1 DUF1236 domain-containing protein [Bradyrhizobium sp. 188]